MSKNDWLSEEEQFKEIINNEEISRIVDLELRNIRFKYWKLFHQTFLDKKRVPDSALEKEFDEIKAEEKKELYEYKLRKKMD